MEKQKYTLAGGWFASSFINPVNDGAVLPIVHVNGGKISNPTIFARKSNDELTKMLAGFGWEAIIVEADVNDQIGIHKQMARKIRFSCRKN